MKIESYILIQPTKATIQKKNAYPSKKQNNKDVFYTSNNKKLENINNSNKISFNGKVSNNNAITDKQIQIINGIIEKCAYGKDVENLLHHDKGIKISYNKDYVFLNNFEKFNRPDFNSLKNSSKKIYGTCLELVYKTSEELKNKLGNDLNIRMVSGKCPDYFETGIHQFFIAYPKKLDSVISTELKLNPNKIPQGSIIIDPSFNKAILAENNPGYDIINVYDLETLDKAGKQYPNELCIPYEIQEKNNLYTSALPFGYFKDFASIGNPGRLNEIFSKETIENSIIYLAFKKDILSYKPIPVIGIQTGPKSHVRLDLSDDIMNMITPNCYLDKLMSRINNEVKLTPKKLFTNFISELRRKNTVKTSK